MTSRRTFLSSAAAMAAAHAGGAPPRPNVLFILADDLGWGDLGCYGSRRIRTPALDGLARTGTRFTQAYANAAVCSPTRAALLSGQYPQRLGIEYVFHGPATEGKGLAPDKTVLPRLLRQNGYRTAMTGKWHLGAEDRHSPVAHGFHEFFGFRNSDHDYYSHRNLDGKPDLWESDRRVDREGYSTDLFGAWAEQYLDRQSAAQPFFLYAAFNSPHWPFQPPGRPEDVRTRDTWMKGTEADYVRMVESLDSAVARLLAKLDQKGLAGNTMVVFTSDNGGEWLSDNGGLFHRKFTLWEGGIRVPAIVRWPGTIRAGEATGQVAVTMDWTATILRAAGVEAAPSLDGIDLLPQLTGTAKARERQLYWRYQHPPRQMVASRSGDWKYVREFNAEFLFDLKSDPQERRDLSRGQPERMAKFKSGVAEWEKQMDASPPEFVIR